MLALTVVAFWFGLVAVYLVRQWWVSELAQAREGVPVPAPVALPAEPVAPVPSLGGRGGGPLAGRSVSDAGWGRASAPSFTWSRAHVAGSAAR
jgi:hypothetical protein